MKMITNFIALTYALYAILIFLLQLKINKKIFSYKKYSLHFVARYDEVIVGIYRQKKVKSRNLVISLPLLTLIVKYQKSK